MGSAIYLNAILFWQKLNKWGGGSVSQFWTKIGSGLSVGTNKMHLSPPVAWAAVRSKAVVLLLLTFCILLLPLWESVTVLCFVVRYFLSILALQSS